MTARIFEMMVALVSLWDVIQVELKGLRFESGPWPEVNVWDGWQSWKILHLSEFSCGYQPLLPRFASLD